MMKANKMIKVWVSNSPTTKARLLAQFALAVDAQKFSDRVKFNNPNWRIEIVKP